MPPAMAPLRHCVLAHTSDGFRLLSRGLDGWTTFQGFPVQEPLAWCEPTRPDQPAATAPIGCVVLAWGEGGLRLIRRTTAKRWATPRGLYRSPPRLWTHLPEAPGIALLGELN